VLKRSRKVGRGKNQESDEFLEDDSEGNINLYGKWQTEPLQLPAAVNGIVPKVSWYCMSNWLTCDAPNCEVHHICIMEESLCLHLL